MKLARCDECGHERSVGHWDAAPGDWFVVEQSSERDGHHWWCFCCASCVASFFLLRDVPGTTNSIPRP